MISIISRVKCSSVTSDTIRRTYSVKKTITRIRVNCRNLKTRRIRRKIELPIVQNRNAFYFYEIGNRRFRYSNRWAEQELPERNGFRPSSNKTPLSVSVFNYSKRRPPKYARVQSEMYECIANAFTTATFVYQRHSSARGRRRRNE